MATSYSYDGAGQLLTEGRTGYSGAYTYDGNGNRLTRTVNGTTETYAYDDGDKLGTVSVGGSAVKTYGYDAAGRTTSVASSAGTTTLAYDYQGLAASISGPGVSQTNSYNGLDTRVGSTTNSVTATYLRDGAEVGDPVLKDGAATYSPGVSERRGTDTTFTHSGVNNVDAQSDIAQTLTATRRYDAFGNDASFSGTFRGPFAYGGIFGYQSDSTGLDLLGHRLYDSSTGRFLTRDPEEDGRNWYTYCENDPINGIDPEGLRTECPWHAPLVRETPTIIYEPSEPGMADDVLRVVLRGNLFLDILLTPPNIGEKPYPEGVASRPWYPRKARIVDVPRKAPIAKKRPKGKPHKKGARPSTREKHQDGQTRRKRDRKGGEKGDKRRPY